MMRAKLLAILMAVVVISGSALADPGDDAIAKVWVDVVANVAVGFVGTGDMGSVQTGPFGTPLVFRVDANTETVDIQVTVSNLYKGDDPTNTDVAPILVDVTSGVGVDPTNGNEIDAGDNILAYEGAGSITAAEGTFDALVTEVGRFESSQNGHFSQDVVVTPSWNQDDPEKPMGEYSGYVQFVCMVVPAAAG